MWATDKPQVDEVIKFKSEFWCLKDPTKLSISGSVDNDHARVIEIDFNRCTGHSDCKSESEINSYLRSGHIALLYNEIKFESHNFADEAVIADSHLHWVSMSVNQQLGVHFEVKLTHVELQDLFVNFDTFTHYKDVGLFTLNEHGVYPAEDDGEDLIFKVRIELDQHLSILERYVYGLLDLAADIGGLASLLLALLHLVMRKYRWYHMDSYLA